MTFREKFQSRIRRRELLTRALVGAASMATVQVTSFASSLLADAVGPGNALKHEGMRVLNYRPLNMETPAHLLNDEITPADRLFVRNNGLMPIDADETAWTLHIDGESVRSPVSFTLEQLKSEFEIVSLQMTLECGGNGRSEFDPPAAGNQWTTGAVGCPKWTGVRLKEVLDRVGIEESAVYIGYYGSDRHLSVISGKSAISRGVPIHKALEPETLLAFAMNDAPIPLAHGYPLRLVVGGWPGSVCGKWLNRISVRDRVHDGAMCIIESLPVKSLITKPQSGTVVTQGEALMTGGFAWAGDHAVASVALSIDFGATWQSAQLASPSNRFAWQRFEHALVFPKTGYFEVWVKATDTQERSQPMVVPGWNPKGYLNNACHRIAVQVVA